MYFEGRGRLLVATPKNGKPGPFRWAGDVDALQLSPKTTTEDIREKFSGHDRLAAQLQKQDDLGFQITFREWLVDNLALSFHGKVATIPGGKVVGETLADGLQQGDIARLEQTQVSQIAIHDSAAEPATLAEGTDYVVNAAHGSVEFIGDLSKYAAPLTASYSYGGGQNIAMFSNKSPERWLRFEGLNKADDQSAVLVEIYRGQTDPVSQADLMSDNISNLQISGSALFDKTKADDVDLGPYGRIIYPAAA